MKIFLICLLRLTVEIPEDLEMQQNILKVQNTRIAWIIMSAIRRLQRKITFFRKQALLVNLYMS